MAQFETLPNKYEQANANEICDHRFRNLLSNEAWNQLPAAVQKRFSKRVKGGDSTVYVGKITAMNISRWGRVLANILRPLGSPLPLHVDVGTPSIVSVTEDATTGGQIWTRLYANKRGFPQMVHSAKRFQGPTGLEEYIGFGIAMALNTYVEEGTLNFESTGYFFTLFGKRIPLPRFLVPLDLLVRHSDQKDGRFEFTLTLSAPLFGGLIYQEGLYREERH